MTCIFTCFHQSRDQLQTVELNLLQVAPFQPETLPDGDLDLGELEDGDGEVLGHESPALDALVHALAPSAVDKVVDRVGARLLDEIQGEMSLVLQIGDFAADQASQVLLGSLRQNSTFIFYFEAQPLSQLTFFC